jgi:HAE1 family hydrophobic/amphiphilic exporter-1
VIYLYLDRLSIAFSRWGRSGNADRDTAEDEHGAIKQAAE